MGCTGKFFCVPMTWNPSDDEFHYIYVNPHDTEAESAFLHTEKRPLLELDHMQLLHRAGYTRAVILDHQKSQIPFDSHSLPQQQPDLGAHDSSAQVKAC